MGGRVIMYLDYCFDKFKNQEPYLHIDEKEWTYIKIHSRKMM